MLEWIRKLSQSNAPALIALKRYGSPGGLAFAALILIVFGVAAKGLPAWLLVVPGLLALGLAALMSPFAVIGEKERGKHLVMTAQRDSARLREQNANLEWAKSESDQILGAVRAHLMVIDTSYRIQSRYSEELENVFHQGDLGSENLLNIFQRLLSERLFKTSRDYLALLFDESKKERTVAKVNPLDEVEINVVNADGSTGLRYISFSFRRILDAGHIVKVLVSVEDVTDRTILERQLRESEQKKVKQFELLLGILHVEPGALNGFVAMANEQLALVDQALKASDFSNAQAGQTALLRQRLDVVMQRVHNIKGNASLLRLDHFERQAQDFEQKVLDLKHRPALGGDDFLVVVIALAEFRGDLDDLQSLRAKLVGIQKSVASHEEAGDPLVQSVTELAQNLSKKYGKPVKIDADGFDSRVLPAAQRLVVKDVLIQLTRNSLVHGIELRDDRHAGGKPSVATIDIHPMIGAAPGSFAFTFRDDGRGLDTQKIRARAVSSGLVDAARAARISDNDMAGFIFAPGFSTSDTTTVDAGRGMGMNIVKQRVVDDSGGEIGIGSEAGKYLEFSFVVPLAARVPTGVQ